MKYELRNYGIGETIGKGFTVFMDNFLLFAGLALPFAIGNELLSQWLSGAINSGIYRSTASFALAFPLLNSIMKFLLNILFCALISRAIAKRFLGSGSVDLKTGIGTVIGHSALAILLQALIMVPFIIGSALIGLFLAWVAPSAIPLFSSALPLLLIVPICYIFIGFSMTSPIIAIERLGPVNALKRSWHLASGFRMRLVGLFLLNFLIVLAITMVFTGFLVFLTSNANLDSGMQSLISSAVRALQYIVAEPLNMAVLTIYYLSIRVQREALDVEGLSANFGEPNYPVDNPSAK
jgi:hypothetical protein